MLLNLEEASSLHRDTALPSLQDNTLPLHGNFENLVRAHSQRFTELTRDVDTAILIDLRYYQSESLA